MTNSVSLISNNKDDTIELGKLISNYVYPNLLICLSGDLGAGKTTFVKGLAEGLNIKEKVLSPTFNILKCYFNDTINLYHIDAYRLEDQNKDIGLEEFIDGDGVCVIEWPIYIKELLPKQYLEIQFKNVKDDIRNIIIRSDIDKLDNLFNKLRSR